MKQVATFAFVLGSFQFAIAGSSGAICKKTNMESFARGYVQRVVEDNKYDANLTVSTVNKEATWEIHYKPSFHGGAPACVYTVHDGSECLAWVGLTLDGQVIKGGLDCVALPDEE